MKNRSIIIAFTIVVCLGLYSYFIEFKGKEDKKKTEEQASALFSSIEKDQVNSLKMTKGNFKIELERSSEGWKLKEPLSDSADSNEVESWISTLLSEKSTSVAVEGNDIQWKYFGFDQPFTSYEISSSSGKKVNLEVSDKKNFEGNAFLRRPNENKVFVGSAVWSSHLSKTAFDLRNKSIFRHQISNVQSIEVKNKIGSFKIENKDANWVSNSHPNWKLDQNIIRDLISKIGEAKATDFLAENELVPAKIKTLKGISSTSRVSIKLSDKVWNAQFFKDKDKVSYVNVEDYKWLVKIPTDVYDRIELASLNDYRDLKLPFASFEKEKAGKIAYETSLKKAVLNKNDANWNLDPVDSSYEVQQDKVNRLLEVLKNLTAKQYVSISGLSSLAKQKLIVSQADGKPLIEMQFSDTQKKKFGTDEKDIRVAKTNLFEEPFYIEELEFEKLGLGELIKIKVNKSDKQNLGTEKEIEKKAK